MTRILVTGASGQLALNLKHKLNAKNFKDKEFLFMSKKELSIDDQKRLKYFFDSCKIDICINCAAFTNVDQAELYPEIAYLSNVLGSKLLAYQCNIHNILLIHISTNYIFDGETQKPYTESDTPKAINIYGASKRAGELAIMKNTKRYFIIRTSWLFSKFKNHFIKTIYEYAWDKKNLTILKDRYGSPTYADDLSEFLLFLIEKQPSCYGVYHFSNQGVCSHYELAEALFLINKEPATSLKPILSKTCYTVASRPTYSALNTMKVQKTFKLKIPHWRESLKSFARSLN